MTDTDTRQQPSLTDHLSGLQNALGAAVYGSEGWQAKAAAIAADMAVERARGDRQARRDDRVAQLRLIQQWAITVLVVILVGVVIVASVGGAVYVGVHLP